MRYRAERASGGAGADVIDTKAGRMDQVIARCGTLGQARLIVDALNLDPGQFPDRIRQLEWGLGQIAAGNDGIWGRIARKALGTQQRPDSEEPRR